MFARWSAKDLISFVRERTQPSIFPLVSDDHGLYSSPHNGYFWSAVCPNGRSESKEVLLGREIDRESMCLHQLWF